MATYLSRPLWDIRPHYVEPVVGQMDDSAWDPLAAGKGIPWKPTTGPRRKVTYEFLLQGAVTWKELRQRVSAAAGRRHGFWLPIWSNEYQLVGDALAAATSLTVRRSGLDEAQGGFNQFNHLFLADESGRLDCHGINGVTLSSGHEVIALSSGLSSPAASSQTLCGGLIYARLAEDSVEYTCLGTDAAGVRITFVELPKEYATAHPGAAPVWLYEFTRGGVTYRYVDYMKDLVAGGLSWTAGDVTHGSIRSGIDFLADPIEVTVATDDPAHPLRLALDRLGMERVEVAVYELDAAALTTLPPATYRGRVQAVRFDRGGRIVLSVSSLLRIGEQNVPRVQVQRTCNHRLFSPGCGLIEGDHTTTGTITALQGTDPAWVEAAEFESASAAESDSNWFALGKVKVGAETRLCVGTAAAGKRLYLNAPFRSAAVSQAISATPGCDKRINTCDVKFANLERFLGFPYIPFIDPNLQPLATPKPSGGKKG